VSKERALTIAFCGIDGSGKTTLAERVIAWLKDQQIPANFHKARTGRSGIERLGDGDVTAIAGGEGAVLMMTAIAWQSIKDSKPARRIPGSVLVYDRYTSCALALCRIYAPQAEKKVRAFVDALPKADVTLYVAASPEIAAARLATRGGSAKTLEFLQAFDGAYRSLPEAADFVIVDGSGTPDDIFANTCNLLRPRISALKPA
jgi:dTMP kinase